MEPLGLSIIQSDLTTISFTYKTSQLSTNITAINSTHALPFNQTVNSPVNPTFCGPNWVAFCTTIFASLTDADVFTNHAANHAAFYSTIQHPQCKSIVSALCPTIGITDRATIPPADQFTIDGSNESTLHSAII